MNLRRFAGIRSNLLYNMDVIAKLLYTHAPTGSGLAHTTEGSVTRGMDVL